MEYPTERLALLFQDQEMDPKEEFREQYCQLCTSGGGCCVSSALPPLCWLIGNALCGLGAPWLYTALGLSAATAGCGSIMCTAASCAACRDLMENYYFNY